MKFRPCIDLHDGKVVQIVGSTLHDDNRAALRVNFSSGRTSAEYAELYRRDGLDGGHVIALGGGNRDAALEALRAFPGGMQYGGGVNPDNARDYLEAGASHVIVTSYVFSGGRIDYRKLEELRDGVGRERLVLDLSCRRKGDDYFVVTDRWQRFTDERLDRELLDRLSAYCDEFLVHGVDVEGTRQGIEEPLIGILGQDCPRPVTYAGGVKTLEDLDRVKELGYGNVDLTVGSALDIFGGDIPYADVLEWHRRHNDGVRG